MFFFFCCEEILCALLTDCASQIQASGCEFYECLNKNSPCPVMEGAGLDVGRSYCERTNYSLTAYSDTVTLMLFLSIGTWVRNQRSLSLKAILFLPIPLVKENDNK